MERERDGERERDAIDTTSEIHPPLSRLCDFQAKPWTPVFLR